ncbi:MAG: glycosyltransferase [Rhodospirillales bacterium]|nr:glycosyltransferase [Rhodospirillales bacterium]
MPSSVSVVIPAYNATATLRVCVEALLHGSVPPLEILIVDDASRDGTPDLARALAAENPGVVRVLTQESNGGPAVARNRGAVAAQGEYLVFVDSDTRPLPDMIERFLARIPEADAVSGIYAMEPLNDGLVPRYKAYFNYYGFSREGVFAYETFSASTAGIRASVFREVGGFNESFAWGMDYENEEIGRRIVRRHRLLLDPAMTSQHAFPDFAKLTRTYFHRVSIWAEFFLRTPKLESGGLATARIGLGTLAAPAAIGTALVAGIWPVLWPVPTALAAAFAWCMSGFYGFVARNRPAFLPAAVLLNVYFSSVIAAGAAYGVLRVLTGTGRVRAGDRPAV